MANCPNCGSDHIQLISENITDTTVNWGRALVGYTLFGVVGGAVGAVTGEGRSVNERAIVCLDCATSWNPQELYQVLTMISQLTNNLTIDLSKLNARLFVNDFIAEIFPYIDEIKISESQHQERMRLIKPATMEEKIVGGLITLLFFSLMGFGFGISISIVLNISVIQIFLIIGLIIGIFFLGIISFIDFKNRYKYDYNRQRQKAEFEFEREKINAKERLNRMIQDFIRNHPLD